jgi:uncharacterized protein Yka (UPF0111/DUF47 family)
MEGNEKKRKKARKHGLLSRIFPANYDFYGMLNKQAEQTSVGVKALLTWLQSGANSDPDDVVREEDKGDQIRLEMERELQGAFSTPFDRQDIYTISRKMDYILNYSMSTAYEMKAFNVKPDEPVIKMAQSLLNGADLVTRSIKLLKEDPNAVEDLIPNMREHERDIEKTYVQTMAIVFAKDDPIVAMKKREIYHHLRDAGRNLSITIDVIHRIIVGLS